MMEARAGPSQVMELSIGEAADLARSMQSDLQGLLSDEFTFNDILAFTLQELNEEADRLDAFVEKLEQQKNSKASKSQSSSRSFTAEQEYKDSLNKKKNFADKLIDVLEAQEPSGLPKFKLQCTEELASGFGAKINEAKEDIINKMPQLLQTKNESKQMESQVQMFLDLFNDDEEEPEEQKSALENIKIKRLFQEAKRDLNTVLTAVYPNDDERTNFMASLKELIEKYSSSETEEEKYVAITPLKIKNKGMRCLLRGGIIIRHPQRANEYRICVED